LRLATGGFARVDPAAAYRNNDYFLLVDRPLAQAQLHNVLLAWERIQRKRLGLECGPTVLALAELFKSVEPERLPLIEYVNRSESSVPTPPGWLFTAAAWYAARRLHGTELALDSRPIQLRAVATLDTESEVRLLSWADPVWAPRADGTQSAMHFVDVRAVTVAGIRDLVIGLRAGTTAMPRFWKGVRFVTMARDDDGLLVELPVEWRGGVGRRYAEAAAEVVAALGVDPLPVPTDEALVTHVDLLRGRFADPPRGFAVGDGAGARFIHRLTEHTTTSLNAEPVRLLPVSHRFPPRPGPTSTPGGLAIAAAQRGVKTIRLLVLYTTPDVRARAVQAIQELVVTPTDNGQRVDAVDDETWRTSLSDDCRLEILAAHVPWLLTAGSSEPRRKQVDTLASQWGLEARTQQLTLALCETDSEQFRHGDHADDPKPQLRRHFASLGVVTQFLSPASAPADAGQRDYAALAAVRDVFQSAGLFDDRYDALLGEALPGGTLLVGLCCRQMRAPLKGFALTLAAIQTPKRTGDQAQALGWLPTGGWLDLATAMTRYHTQPLFPKQLEGNAHAQVRVLTHASVAALPRTGSPIVIFAAVPRGVWHGLNDRTLGTGALPGDPDSGAGRDDVHIVRVTPPDTGLTLTPAAVQNGSHITQTRLTERLHHLVTDYPVPAYWLVNRSRQLGRYGAKEIHFDRYALLEHSKYARKELATPWHGMTATEFVVLRAPTLSANQLATLAARLCDRPPAWDRRTALPAPAHLAQRMRTEHPATICP
jgi:hypothetical protein